MLDEDQDLGLPYSAVGELHIFWRKRRGNNIETGETWASGFPVGNGSFIATAAHLICGDGMVEARAEYVTAGRTIAAQWIAGNQPYCDSRTSPAVYDVAVVKLASAVPNPLPFKSVSGRFANKACRAAGYLQHQLTIRDATIATWPLERETFGGPFKYALGTTQRGMSGGPLFDPADGQVIGIISGDDNAHCMSAPLVAGGHGAGYDFLTEVISTNRAPNVF